MPSSGEQQHRTKGENPVEVGSVWPVGQGRLPAPGHQGLIRPQTHCKILKDRKNSAKVEARQLRRRETVPGLQEVNVAVGERGGHRLPF